MSALRLASIDDLSVDVVDGITDPFSGPPAARSHPSVVGLVFLEPSLRTRVGFAVAAQRLGGQSVVIEALRDAPTMSASESIADTVRTVAGMVDAVVVRAPCDLAAEVPPLPVPWINAGDAVEHPSQVLVDLAAMRRFAGPPTDQSIVVVGDMEGRAVRSLLIHLARCPPRRLLLVSPPSRRGAADESAEWTPALANALDHGIDVVYVAGLPERRGDDVLDDDTRRTYSIGPEALDALRDDAVVLSPLPVIDEVSPSARKDVRFRAFAQSDGGVAVRAALLDHLIPVAT